MNNIYNPWNNWPDSGLALVSGSLKVDYPTLKKIVQLIQHELTKQGVGKGSLVEIRLVDYLAWPVTLALFRLGAAS